MKNELTQKVNEFITKNIEFYGEDLENLKIDIKENEIYFTGEFDYEQGYSYGAKLDKILQKHNKDWYFDFECPGRLVAYLN